MHPYAGYQIDAEVCDVIKGMGPLELIHHDCRVFAYLGDPLLGKADELERTDPPVVITKRNPAERRDLRR